MRPSYHLVPEFDPRPDAISLTVTGEDPDRMFGRIAFPEWQELRRSFDGPHDMPTALYLADSYAEAYGYRVVMVDIEGSQLWNPAWGELLR